MQLRVGNQKNMLVPNKYVYIYILHQTSIQYFVFYLLRKTQHLFSLVYRFAEAGGIERLKQLGDHGNLGLPEMGLKLGILPRKIGFEPPTNWRINI